MMSGIPASQKYTGIQDPHFCVGLAGRSGPVVTMVNPLLTLLYLMSRLRKLVLSVNVFSQMKNTKRGIKMFKSPYYLMLYLSMVIGGGSLMVISILPPEDQTFLMVTSFIVAMAGIILTTIYSCKNDKL